MRNFLLVSMMVLIATLSLGCGLSMAQRQVVVDEISEYVTAEVVDKTKEIAGDVAEKAIAVITEKAAELGLSEDKVKELGDQAAARAKEEVDRLVKEKLPNAIRDAVEKVVPEATKAEGGTGKGILGGLFGLAQLWLGMGAKGGLA